MRVKYHAGDTLDLSSGERDWADVVSVHDADIPFYTLDRIADDEAPFMVSAHELNLSLASSLGKTVIALAGENRVGKTSTAIRLARELRQHVGDDGVKIVSFADPLRHVMREANVMVGQDSWMVVGYRDAQDEAVYAIEEELGTSWGSDSIDDRDLLRAETEYIKKYYPGQRDAMINLSAAIRSINPTIWIDHTVDRIDELFRQGVQYVIIDDLRTELQFQTLRHMVDDLTVYALTRTGFANERADQMRTEWAKDTEGRQLAGVTVLENVDAILSDLDLEEIKGSRFSLRIWDEVTEEVEQLDAPGLPDDAPLAAVNPHAEPADPWEMAIEALDALVEALGKTDASLSSYRRHLTEGQSIWLAAKEYYDAVN